MLKISCDSCVNTNSTLIKNITRALKNEFTALFGKPVISAMTQNLTVSAMHQRYSAQYVVENDIYTAFTEFATKAEEQMAVVLSHYEQLTGIVNAYIRFPGKMVAALSNILGPVCGISGKLNT